MMGCGQIPQSLFNVRYSKHFIDLFVLFMVCALNSVKAQNDTILVDFGEQVSPAKWNFFSSFQVSAVQVMYNSKGEITNSGLRVTSKFVANNASGTVSPDPFVGFPGTVTADNIYKVYWGSLEKN